MAILDVTSANLEQEVLKADGPVVADFWAPWCGYCRRLSPVIDIIANNYAGKLKVVKVNIDDAPELKERFGIKMIPTLVMFKGGEAVGVSEAPKSKADVDGWLTSQGI